MLRKYLLSFAILFLSSPAYAMDYLVFQAGENKSTEVWRGVEPDAKNLPEGARVKAWVPERDKNGNLDTDLSHYIDSGASGIERVIPAPPLPGPPQPDIPKFFDGLVKTILSGQIPGDVHSKALMVKDLKSPADQAAALTAFSSDPSYTKEQKLILDTLIKESNLALPDVPGKE